jgi:hypothetical protein
LRNKVRRIIIAIVAILLLFCAIDYSVIPILLLVNGGEVTLRMFFFVAVFANFELMVWYILGPEIIPVLQDLYKIIYKERPGWVRRFFLMLLRKFYHWEVTKVEFEMKLKAYFHNKKTLVAMCFVGVFAPGVRVMAAIIFSLTGWKKGLAALMILNLLHIIYSLGSWILLKEIFMAIYPALLG